MVSIVGAHCETMAELGPWPSRHSCASVSGLLHRFLTHSVVVMDLLVKNMVDLPQLWLESEWPLFWQISLFCWYNLWNLILWHSKVFLC